MPSLSCLPSQSFSPLYNIQGRVGTLCDAKILEQKGELEKQIYASHQLQVHHFTLCKPSFGSRILSSHPYIFFYPCLCSVNKKSESFEENHDAESCSGHKWGLRALLRHLAKEGHDTEKIWRDICDIVVKVGWRSIFLARTWCYQGRQVVPFHLTCHLCFLSSDYS